MKWHNHCELLKSPNFDCRFAGIGSGVDGSTNRRILIVVNSDAHVYLLRRLWHAGTYLACRRFYGMLQIYVFYLIMKESTNSSLKSLTFAPAHMTILADGAANRVYDAFPEDRDHFIPDYICGDLDSIRSDVRAYYENVRHCISAHCATLELTWSRRMPLL